MSIVLEPHERAAVLAFETHFEGRLEDQTSPALEALLADPEGALASAPRPRNEELRSAVRDLLRLGGYKPTGRGKPSSEYLVRAAGEGQLSAINVAVDAGNLVSLCSGVPISVVDLDRVSAPLRVGIAGEGAQYVFNRSGQCIDLGGLLCLSDAEGPCANAVKDAQRSKTDGETTRTLSVIWAPASHAQDCAQTVEWYRGLLESAGASTLTVECISEGEAGPR